MVKWQEVGRVISAVHHHGPQGLKTSEIQKLVRKQPNSRFNFKEALDEAVKTGFLRVRNHRFYPCNWQELVNKRKRGPRLPRGMQRLSSDSCCTGVETARRRRRASRSGRRRSRGRKHTSSRRRSPRAYTRRRNIKSRGGANSSYASRRRRRSQRPRRQVKKASRSRRRSHARGHRRARVGSNEKLAPDGSNGVTPAEHATGKKYPPR